MNDIDHESRVAVAVSSYSLIEKRRAAAASTSKDLLDKRSHVPYSQ